ncbi:MAG: hypothetical protein PHE78_02870 [Candidatus Gastranaerophilales bacterium]|nr:hypothetical protein [Candidatus Gastranaerophilales bacterium]
MDNKNIIKEQLEYLKLNIEILELSMLSLKELEDHEIITSEALTN